LIGLEQQAEEELSMMGGLSTIP